MHSFTTANACTFCLKKNDIGLGLKALSAMLASCVSVQTRASPQSRVTHHTVQSSSASSLLANLDDTIGDNTLYDSQN